MNRKHIMSKKRLVAVISVIFVLASLTPMANLFAMPESVQALYRSGIVTVATGKLDSPYLLGARGPSKFDCSGLTWYCYNKCGYTISKESAAKQAEGMREDGREVSTLKNGYLIFYDYNKIPNGRFMDIDHVSIYIGNGYMIDASSSNKRVIKRSSTIMQSVIVMKARPATYL